MRGQRADDDVTMQAFKAGGEETARTLRTALAEEGIMPERISCRRQRGALWHGHVSCDAALSFRRNVCPEAAQQGAGQGRGQGDEAGERFARGAAP